MPVFTFSTKAKKPGDTEMVERAQLSCARRGQTFSDYVIKALAEYEKCQQSTKKNTDCSRS